MRVAREQRAHGAVDLRLGVVGVLALGVAHRVHTVGADDGGVQAFVVQHHHRIVEARLGVHHVATGIGLALDLAHAGRHIAQAVHARQVVVAKGGDGAAKVVRGQAGGVSPLHHKLQQLRLLKDAQNQLAVADVVNGQRRFVVAVAPVDLGHLVVGIANGLALTQQRLRDAFQAERRENPHGGAQRLDAVHDQAARGGCEEIALLARMGAPLDWLALAAQQQRRGALVCRLLQHAQVKLDDTPAHDDVRVVAREPVVQAFDHGLAGRQVHKCKVQRLGGFSAFGRILRRLAQHKDHALWHAVQRDGVQRTGLAGLDVQGHTLEHWAIVRIGLELAVDDGAGLLNATALHHHTGGDESLHQVAVMGTHIGFQQGNVLRSQLACQLPKLAKLLGIDPDDGALLKGFEIEFAQLHARHGRNLRLYRCAEPGLYKGHRRVPGQQHLQRSGVRCQPELNLGARGRVPPVAGQDETLALGRHGKDEMGCCGYCCCRQGGRQCTRNNLHPGRLGAWVRGVQARAQEFPLTASNLIAIYLYFTGAMGHF